MLKNPKCCDCVAPFGTVADVAELVDKVLKVITVVMAFNIWRAKCCSLSEDGLEGCVEDEGQVEATHDLGTEGNFLGQRCRYRCIPRVGVVEERNGGRLEVRHIDGDLVSLV